MKTKKIGTVNGAILCTLQDKNGNVLGHTIDTPNAIAYAMATNKNVFRSVAHYALFGDSIRTREQLNDRFAWVASEKDLSKFLKWT